MVLDSRGFPTVEADVWLADGSRGRAAVPSGASTGRREARELRDGGQAFGGKGVNKAIANVNQVIRPRLIGQLAEDQAGIDACLKDLDGTADKRHLGANALLSVSLSVAKAEANARRWPLFRYVAHLSGHQQLSLPMPMMNILNGGKHATGSTDIQEFMIVPVGAKDISQAIQMGAEVFHTLGKVLYDSGYATTVGDEGGFAPAVKGGTDEVLALLRSAVEAAGYVYGQDVALALDVAASELVKDGLYDFSREGQQFTSNELINLYERLLAHQPLVSLEDGLGEDDWAGWRELTKRLGSKLQLVGDDLLVTNPALLNRAIEDKAANAILIKPNQIGTLSETIEAVTVAQAAGWRTVISHRSGETEDTTIAHLAVGLNAGQIKTGSLSRSERLAKYNELLRIAELIPHAELNNPYK